MIDRAIGGLVLRCRTTYYINQAVVGLERCGLDCTFFIYRHRNTQGKTAFFMININSRPQDNSSLPLLRYMNIHNIVEYSADRLLFVYGLFKLVHHDSGEGDLAVLVDKIKRRYPCDMVCGSYCGVSHSCRIV